MSWLWFVLLAVAAGYQLACALLCLAFQTEVRAFSDAGFRPGVSLLKPVRGWSRRTAANLATFEALTYDGPCQTVFTAARQGDPAVAALGSRVIDGTPSQGHNRKIAGLVAGVARARHDLLVVSDADIRVSSDYLERVCAAFQEEQVGLVTSLYRASPASTLGAAFEALCIADFSASVLVARRTEGLAFALGATMAVRRQALEAIGGFQALEDYLADDFQLGYQVARAGWQVRLAPTVVETDLGEVDLAGALSHQLRWMVTSRVSRPGGHAAFIVTQGLLWAMLLAASTGHWWIVPGWWVWRWLTTAVVWRALGARCRWWLLPLKEFAYLVLWVASLVTDTVRWGEDRYRIDRQGKDEPAVIGLLMLLCAFPLEPTALDALVEGAIGQGQMAGAVLLVGRGREVLYHKAYGFRQLEPERLPMTTDTLFDVASLTKPMATGLAINWLFEQGKLSPTDHVADYLPQVDPRLTVEQLLLHRAGFAPDPPLEADWDQILASRPLGAPGQDFLYSDIGYLILGKLVEKVDGRPLDRLCAEEFYAPLGMVDTGFNPAPRERVAATEGQLSGRVHDPRAARLGGVAGHAGLFSTTSDTARFAVMLLEGGANVLKPETVRAMTANHQGRSFGFDVDTSFSTARGDRFPVGTSFGHTGFTGTSLWVDPASRLYVILFTNRLHPDGKGSVVELRHQVATAVADQLLGPPVKLGIDRLVEQDLAPLRGHRVGLVTNHTGRDSQGRRTIDLLAQAEGVELVCLFSPEHGLGGDRDEKIGNSVDQPTGLPIYSLYGQDRRPRPEWLAQVDTVVFDIQDSGCRFYTYISTLKAVLETAPRVVVLDRPNPLGGELVDGWLAEQFDFIACAPIPLVHGMTVGELAQLFHQSIGTELVVVKMEGWRRSMTFEQTGLTWVNPSPNLRSTTACHLYPAIGLLEWANLSVGRGTDAPFERLGAPWIGDQRQLAWRLNMLQLPGLRFVPIRFTPGGSVFAGQECGGVEVVLTDRQALRPALAGLRIAWLLAELYPEHFMVEKMSRHVANAAVLDSIKSGPDQGLWRASLDQFLQDRQKALLY